ncbi:unnamed protein product [Blepharisma stoltei]|uniref:Sfi1 spindle body domain-containing protein n=1 Tax=Blepharisma stoltei TaxID=1481888 RepID=A0AAU9IBI4_9CILI|nr:unnamed protein product [Blepharisma stoltei]
MNQEVICEILTDAGKQGKITLLSALYSYDKILQQRQIDKLSIAGTNLYKILLIWGRDKNNLWWEKYDKEFGRDSGALKLDELISAKNKADPPSFDEKSALQFLKTIKEQEQKAEQNSKLLSSLKESLSFGQKDFDNELKSFKETLPKFKDFNEQLKKPVEKTIDTSMFRAELFVKKISKLYLKKFWKNWWRDLGGITKFYKESLLKKTFYALTSHVHNSLRLKLLAEKSTKTLGTIKLRMYFEAWTQYKLLNLRKELSLKIADKMFMKKIWEIWKKEMRKTEILKTMKYTANFIHKQWLLKKSFLALARHVNKSMNMRVLEDKAINKINNLKLGVYFTAWLEFNKIRLEEKLSEEFSKKIADKFYMKKIWRLWKREMKRVEKLREIKKSVHMIHNQWLIKNSLYGLVWNVNRNTNLKMLEMKAIEKIENIERKVYFQSWLEYNRIKLIKKINGLKGDAIEQKADRKLLVKTIAGWNEVAQWYKCTAVLSSKRIIPKIVQSWKKYTRKMRMIKYIYSTYDEKSKKSLKVNSFNNWHQKFKILNKRRENKIISSKMIRKKLLKKYISQWTKKYSNKVKKHHISHIGAKFFFDKTLTNYWQIWRKLFLKRITIEIKSENYGRREETLIRKAMKGWFLAQPIIRIQNQRLRRIREEYAINLAKKSIKAWRDNIVYHKTKIQLYNHLHKSIEVIKKRQIIKAMKIYSEWKIKQNQRDSMLVTQVYRLRKETIMKKWYNRALLFSSCRYFEEAMFRYQKRCFIKKLAQNLEMQHLTLAYLDIHREQNLIKTVFTNWQGWILKKKSLKSRYLKFKLISHKYKLLKPFARWKRAYFGIACAFQSRFLYLKNQVFQWWANITQRKHVELEMQAEMIEKCKNREKSRVFYSWLCAAIKRQQAIFNANSLMTIRLQKWFDMWRKEFAWKMHKNEAINYIQSANSLYNQRRALFILKNNADYSQEKKNMNEKAFYMYKMKVAGKVISIWHENAKEFSSNNVEVNKILVKVNKRIITEAFKSWLGAVSHKFSKMKAVKWMEAQLGIKSLKNSMKKWNKEAKSARAKENLDNCFEKIYDNILKKRCLKCWIVKSSNRKTLKSKENALKSLSNTNTLSRCLKSWTSEVKYKIETSTKREKINKNFIKKLKSKILKSWRDLSVDRKVIIDKLIKFKKNCSLKLSSKILKEVHSYADKKIIFKEKLGSASNSINKSRKLFAINKLHENANKKINAKEMINTANKFRKIFLTKKAIISLAHNTELSKSIKLKTSEFVSSIEFILNHFKLQNSFSIVKGIFFNEKEMLGTAEKELKTCSLRRVIQGWLREARTKANLILKKEILLKKRNEKIEKETLETWQNMMKLSFAVKKFSYKLKRKSTKKFFSKWRSQFKCIEFIKQKKFLIKSKIFKSIKNYAKTSHDTIKKLEFSATIKNTNFSYVVFNAWKSYYLKNKNAEELRIKFESKTEDLVKKILKSWHEWAQKFRKNIETATAFIKKKENDILKKYYQIIRTNYKQLAFKRHLEGFLLRKSMISWLEFVNIDKKYELIAEAAHEQFLKQKTIAFFKNLKLLLTLKQKKEINHEKIYYIFCKKAFNQFRLAFYASRASKSSKIKATQHIHAIRKLKVLYSWKLWLQQRFEAHITVEENMVKAYEHYHRSLISRAFYGWDNEISSSGVKKTRSIMHSIFSAWKIATRESSLLKRYLRESNISERYMRTSRDHPESALVTLRSVSSVGSISSQ